MILHRAMAAVTEPPVSKDAPEEVAAAALEQISERLEQLAARNEGLLQRIIDGESRFRVLARAVWRAQEEERRRLARELHDSVCQTLTALITKLRTLPEGAERSDVDAAADIAQLALNDVRELSRLLRPPVLDDLGLEAGLNWLTRKMRDSHNLATTLEWEADEFERLDPEVETLIFRIAQEGLNNVVQHSGRREARLLFRRLGNLVEFEVADEGCGFDAADVLGPEAKNKSLGLRGIRDRVELFGGRLDIRSGAGKGCRLRVTLPIGELRE